MPTARIAAAGKINYSSDADAPAVSGSPLSLLFAEERDPEAFLERILDVEAPFYNWGVKRRLDDTGEYWKAVCTRFDIQEDADGIEQCESADSFSIEVTPTWGRIYVDADADAENISEFLTVLEEEMNVRVFAVEQSCDYWD